MLAINPVVETLYSVLLIAMFVGAVGVIVYVTLAWPRR